MLFLLIFLCFSTGALAQGVDAFLPKGAATEATYVVLERDPAFDDYGRRMRAARERNSKWFAEYARQLQKAGIARAPYHENFGVTRQEYEHFSQPMNQFREASKKAVTIRRSDRHGQVQLDFQGEDLLLAQVKLDLPSNTVRTPLDVLVRREFVDVEIASLPPGRHRGVYYVTPDATIAASKRRESLLIGELKDERSGIIHYATKTAGGLQMVYFRFAK